MATGLIVGESLFGVVFAGIVAASGSDAPLAVVGEDFENWAARARGGAVRGHDRPACAGWPAAPRAHTPRPPCVIAMSARSGISAMRERALTTILD